MPQRPAGTGLAMHLTSMPAGKRLNYVTDFVLRSESYRQQVEQEWIDAYLRYVNHVEPRSDWKSNLRFALEYAQIETAKSAIFQKLTEHGEPVTFLPLHADDAERANVVTRAVNHLLWVNAGLPTHLEDFLQDFLNYGPGIFKIGWSSRIVRVPLFEKVQLGEAEPMSIRTSEREVVVEGPAVTTVDPWDYFPDPQGANEDEQELTGDRVWMSRLQIEARVKEGLWNREAAQMLLAQKEYAAFGSGNTREAAIGPAGRGTPGPGGWQNETTARYPVLELWHDRDGVTLACLGGQRYEELRSIKNRAPHGKKPYVIEHHVRQRGDPIGLSQTRFVGPISDAISAFHNQANDTRRLAIDGRPIIRSGILLRDSDLVGGPGDPIRVPNPGTDIKPFEVGGRIELAGAEEAVLMQWADRVGAQSDPGRGMPTPGGSGTATEVSAVTSAQQTRSMLVVARAARALERLYHKAHLLTQQNMTSETAVKMLGRKGWHWRMVSAEDLAGAFMPQARATFLDQEGMSKPNRWLTIMRDMGRDPYLDPIELRRRFFDAIGEDDTDGLLVNPMEEAEIPQVQENTLLLQGVPLPVKANDDHMAHIMALQALTQVQVLPDGRPNTALQDHTVKTAIMQHWQAHMQALAAQQQMAQVQGTSGGAPPAGGGRASQGEKIGGGYDGARSNGRLLASRTPGGGQGAPPGPLPAERGGGVA